MICSLSSYFVTLFNAVVMSVWSFISDDKINCCQGCDQSLELLAPFSYLRIQICQSQGEESQLLVRQCPAIETLDVLLIH